MLRALTLSALLTAAITVGGCTQSKEDILKKAEGASTKTALEDALGRPDDIQKLGPLETWTYRGSNGAVSFVIAGEQVTLSTTSDTRER
jgi:hypothetical protein